MPDLTKAKEAAERVAWIRHNLETIGQWDKVDLREFYERDVGFLLSLLSSPADYLDELLAEPEWIQPPGFNAYWRTFFGTYEVEGEGRWYRKAGMPRHEYPLPCDSLEAGKLACWEDYKRRIAPAFRKDETHA